LRAQAGDSLRLLFAKHPACSQENRTSMPESHQIDIHHIARLARLQLTEEEAIQYHAQLEGILSYIDTLSRYDLDEVDPTAHAMPVFDVIREDVPGHSLDKDAVLNNAPKSTAGQFQIPKVIE